MEGVRVQIQGEELVINEADAEELKSDRMKQRKFKLLEEILKGSAPLLFSSRSDFQPKNLHP